MTTQPIASRPFQFGVGTLLLLMTVVAAHLAALMASPLLGVPLLLLGVPGLIRAFAHLQRLTAAGQPPSLHAKLDAYFTSLVATLVAYIAAAGVLTTSGGLVYVAGVIVAESVGWIAPLVFLAWFLTFLGFIACACLAAGMFFALYWETLPSAGDDDTSRRAR